ncbi:phenazine biosynthesis protein PhzF family [Actinobacteria bacterium OK074]|nr:phenazine biosynthesis protein PhzF family [Actinobacteria bacterium OK074]
MTPHPYALADVFTDRPLAGNQVAVFLQGERLDEELLQKIALEMNLSETTFVFPAADGADAAVRLFSTVVEVPWAGHPLLGTAVVLAREAEEHTRTWHLATPGGVIPIRTERLDEVTYNASMQQPIPKVTAFEKADELLAVLGLEASLLPVEVQDAGIPHTYVTAPTVEFVESLVPDWPRLREVLQDRRLSVFAHDGRGGVVSRMLSPKDRVPEDPACGSAAGPLAAHLLRHGRIASGQEITIAQGAQVGRPSVLYAIATGSPKHIENIEVRGGVCLIGGGALNLG